MPEPPRTGDAVLELVRKSELADDDVLKSFLLRSGPVPSSAADTATRLVQSGILTRFQAQFILQGKHKGFRLGPYRILDQIGSGGMGHVYLAEHIHLHRRVAIKVLPPKLAADKSWVNRFYREARAAAALDHPNVVHAYDVAFDNGAHFLVLEYVPGKTLQDALSESGGRLPISRACGYIAQVAAGLQHAHEKGVSHRDIKPANLLVSDDGTVKILDMGLARFFQSPIAGHDPEHGIVMGTTDYIAPEQATACSQADHRVDIYSLGATFYHLVTGQPPFEGSTAAKLIAHQLHDVPTAHEVRADVPERISGIIARMMAKAPADRYQTALEVVEELLPYCEHVPVVSTTASGRLVPYRFAQTEPSAPVPARKPNEQWALGLVAATVVLSMLFVILFLLVVNP
jgi:serine/threonine-protein kinase